MKTLHLLAATAAVALAATPAAFAAPKFAGSPSPKLSNVRPPRPAKGTIHVPIGSIVSGAETISPVTVAPATFTPMDGSQQFTCTSDNGCTIIATAMAQVSASVDGGSFAICPAVDGAVVAEGCAYQGALLAADGFRLGNSEGDLSVSKGKHTVQTLVYIDEGGSYDWFHATYQITTP